MINTDTCYECGLPWAMHDYGECPRRCDACDGAGCDACKGEGCFPRKMRWDDQRLEWIEKVSVSA